jgi:hypothetical protein
VVKRGDSLMAIDEVDDHQGENAGGGGGDNDDNDDDNDGYSERL